MPKQSPLSQLTLQRNLPILPAARCGKLRRHGTELDLGQLAVGLGLLLAEAGGPTVRWGSEFWTVDGLGNLGDGMLHIF